VTKITSEINKCLDRFENEATPSLQLDTNAINFGSVRFLDCETRTISIENTGRVNAKYMLVPAMGATLKSWCAVEPSLATIKPGTLILSKEKQFA
jgi:hypothetical protein